MASDIDRDALDKALKPVADKLRNWWAFDEDQQHIHSWHTREDFIETILPEVLEAAILAYRSAMEAKMRPAEEVANTVQISGEFLCALREIAVAAILADRKERA